MKRANPSVCYAASSPYTGEPIKPPLSKGRWRVSGGGIDETGQPLSHLRCQLPLHRGANKASLE